MKRKAWLAVMAAGMVVPAVAGAVTIYYTIWHAIPPEQPAAPAFSEADFKAVAPADPAALPAAIEAATGGEFHVAGPVTVSAGPLARSTVYLSAPVAFAEAATIDEDQKMRPYTIHKGSVFFHTRFAGTVKGVPASIAVWCGPVTVSGLITSDILMCRAPKTNGDIGLFSGALAGIETLAVDWFPGGIDMNDKLVESEHYPMPKMTPLKDAPADMTLEMLVDGGRSRMSAQWRLTKSGNKHVAWLYSGGEDVSPPNWVVPSGSHFVYPLGQTWLAFDYDPKAKQIMPLGVVSPGH